MENNASHLTDSRRGSLLLHKFGNDDDDIDNKSDDYIESEDDQKDFDQSLKSPESSINRYHQNGESTTETSFPHHNEPQTLGLYSGLDDIVGHNSFNYCKDFEYEKSPEKEHKVNALEEISSHLKGTLSFGLPSKGIFSKSSINLKNLQMKSNLSNKNRGSSSIGSNSILVYRPASSKKSKKEADKLPKLEKVEKKKESEKIDHLNEELQIGYRILSELMADSLKTYNSIFLESIELDTSINGDYLEVVKKPVWLPKIKENLLKGEYKTITELVTDIRLMLENTYRYFGASHSFSRKGLRMEFILEQKLNLLSRDLKAKCTLEVTHGISPELFKEINRNKSSRITVNGDNHFSYLLYNVRGCRPARDKVLKARRVEMMRKAKIDKEKEMVEWEEKLLDGPLGGPMKNMWEIPQIGQFLFLSSRVLNISEISIYELERILMIPEMSVTLCMLMTSLVSSPQQRAKLAEKPFMPYNIWVTKFAHKTFLWYKVYYREINNPDKVYEQLGIEPTFWKVCGKKNPFDTHLFHEMSLYQRIWLLKSLCDYIAHNHKSVQEAIAEQPEENQRENILGSDSQGNQYIYFPQVTGGDLRIYRRMALKYNIDMSTPEDMQVQYSNELFTKEQIKSFRKHLKRIRKNQERDNDWEYAQKMQRKSSQKKKKKDNKVPFWTKQITPSTAEKRSRPERLRQTPKARYNQQHLFVADSDFDSLDEDPSNLRKKLKWSMETSQEKLNEGDDSEVDKIEDCEQEKVETEPSQKEVKSKQSDDESDSGNCKASNQGRKPRGHIACKTCGKKFSSKSAMYGHTAMHVRYKTTKPIVDVRTNGSNIDDTAIDNLATKLKEETDVKLPIIETEIKLESDKVITNKIKIESLVKVEKDIKEEFEKSDNVDNDDNITHFRAIVKEEELLNSKLVCDGNEEKELFKSITNGDDIVDKGVDNNNIPENSNDSNCNLNEKYIQPNDTTLNDSLKDGNVFNNRSNISFSSEEHDQEVKSIDQNNALNKSNINHNDKNEEKPKDISPENKTEGSPLLVIQSQEQDCESSTANDLKGECPEPEEKSLKVDSSINENNHNNDSIVNSEDEDPLIIPNPDEFELVACSLSELRNLISKFGSLPQKLVKECAEKEADGSETDKKEESDDEEKEDDEKEEAIEKENEHNENEKITPEDMKRPKCEEKLHRALCKLLMELAPMESKMTSSFKQARKKLWLEFSEWKKRDANYVDPAEEAWLSDPEPDIIPSTTPTPKPSSSSSSSDESLNDDGTRKRKLRKRRAKKVTRESSPVAVSTGPPSIESSDQEAVAVSSRGRIRKVKKIFNYDKMDFDKLAQQSKIEAMEEKERKKKKREEDLNDISGEQNDQPSNLPKSGTKRIIHRGKDNLGQDNKVSKTYGRESVSKGLKRNKSDASVTEPNALVDEKTPKLVVSAINEEGKPVYVRVFGEQALRLISLIEQSQNDAPRQIKLQRFSQSYTFSTDSPIMTQNISGYPDSDVYNPSILNSANQPKPNQSPISSNSELSYTNDINSYSGSSTLSPITHVTPPKSIARPVICSRPSNAVAIAYQGVPSQLPPSVHASSSSASLSSSTKLVTASPSVVPSAPPITSSAQLKIPVSCPQSSNSPVATSQILVQTDNGQQLKVNFASDRISQLVQKSGQRIMAIPNGKGGYTLTLVNSSDKILSKPASSTGVFCNTETGSKVAYAQVGSSVIKNQQLQLPLSALSSPKIGETQQHISSSTSYAISPQVVSISQAQSVGRQVIIQSPMGSSNQAIVQPQQQIVHIQPQNSQKVIQVVHSGGRQQLVQMIQAGQIVMTGNNISLQQPSGIVVQQQHKNSSVIQSTPQVVIQQSLQEPTKLYQVAQQDQFLQHSQQQVVIQTPQQQHIIVQQPTQQSQGIQHLNQYSQAHVSNQMQQDTTTTDLTRHQFQQVCLSTEPQHQQVRISHQIPQSQHIRLSQQMPENTIQYSQLQHRQVTNNTELVNQTLDNQCQTQTIHIQQQSQPQTQTIQMQHHRPQTQTMQLQQQHQPQTQTIQLQQQHQPQTQTIQLQQQHQPQTIQLQQQHQPQTQTIQLQQQHQPQTQTIQLQQQHQPQTQTIQLQQQQPQTQTIQLQQQHQPQTIQLQQQQQHQPQTIQLQQQHQQQSQTMQLQQQHQPQTQTLQIHQRPQTQAIQIQHQPQNQPVQMQHVQNQSVQQHPQQHISVQTMQQAQQSPQRQQKEQLSVQAAP